MSIRIGRRQFLMASGAMLAAPMISRGARRQSKTVKLAWIRQFAPAAAGPERSRTRPCRRVNRRTDRLQPWPRRHGCAAEGRRDRRGLPHRLLAVLPGARPRGSTSRSSRVSATGLNALVISTRGLPKNQIDDKNKAYIGPEPWKQLVGKTIGTARGSQMEFLLRSYMKTHGSISTRTSNSST